MILGRDTVIREWHRLTTRKLMVWFPIPRFWKVLNWCQRLEIIMQFIRKSMTNWNTELTSCGEYLATIDIRSSIFQGDSLSTLLFVICVILLAHIKEGWIWVHLENRRKVEPPFVYWGLKDLCKEWAWRKWIGFQCTNVQQWCWDAIWDKDVWCDGFEEGK